MSRAVRGMALLFFAFCACKPAQRAVVKTDGSSTVFLITEAVAEEFQKERHAQVTVAISGTGGGLHRLCAGEIDLANASRPIRSSEEALCAKNGIGYVELPIAYDGIAVLVNAKNDWTPSLTTAQLKKIWERSAQAKVLRWNQVVESWPDRE